MTASTPLDHQGITINRMKIVPDSIIRWGYFLLAVSLLLYAIEEIADVRRQSNQFAVFFLHYLIAVAYALLLLFNSSLGFVKSWRSKHIHKTVVALNLFLISAYALNREIPVFEQSTKWLCCFLIITSAVLLSFKYYAVLPVWINKLQFIFLGSAFVLYLYLAACCASLYMFGGIGLLAFGVGGHILVPLFLVIVSIMLVRDARTVKDISLSWMIAGIALTLSVVAAFAGLWTTRVKAIERIANISVLHPDTELPVWVKVAETVNNDWVTERMLKSDLVYKVASDFRWNDFSRPVSWNEQREHDPLVFIATLFRRAPLSREERIKILEAITDSRHKAQQRLWSGDNLVTSDIVTDADIYADLHLAYTERYFNVRNDRDPNRTWGTSEEAIYTFQLPEGSVVTSLSLWVNGKEERAILTSKQKADEAYTTIVGTEQRDPSVVHWQEGNTITVRVFPCTPTEMRKFKIGITSPLQQENGRLVYKGISFQGPGAYGADEIIRIRFIGSVSDVDLPDAFEHNEKGEFVCEQNYDPDLAITFKSHPVVKNQFTFGGFTYSLSDFTPASEARDFSALYLDINRSWSKREVTQLQPLLQSRKVYVCDDEDFLQLTNENWDDVISERLKRNFSVFPFHRLKNLDESLVISKGAELSPFLSDFKDSRFAKSVSDFFASKKKVYVYNLSSSTATYIKSLRELRALSFASGDVEELFDWLDKKQFPVVIENDQQVVLHDAKLAITRVRSSGDPRNTAPDHLARLFVYNDIMRQVGPNYFSDDFVNDELVQEATAAYVVSPVSSLVVLETKNDYERFGIQDSNNSLHNAAKASSGAVPEPHEWALIAVFAFFVLFCFRKQLKGLAIYSR